MIHSTLTKPVGLRLSKLQRLVSVAGRHSWGTGAGLEHHGLAVRPGLERYAPAFREAEVTPGTLPELINPDLRELGLPLGPRKVVKAVRGLAGLAAAGIMAIRLEAERRQLTVMFCDLAGSTPRRCATS